MLIEVQTVLVLGILMVTDAGPQGSLFNRWGTNENGGYSVNIPSGNIIFNWNNRGRAGKSASLLPEEVEVINTIVNGIGRDVPDGNENVAQQIEVVPAIQIPLDGSAVQPSNPTTTNFRQNLIGAADINGSERPVECYGIPSPGECRGAFPRFFYNSSLDQCDCFLFGGCGEEEIQSSWITYEECFSTCGPSNTEEGPRCRLLPKQDIVTFAQPEILNTPDTSHLSDTDLINAFLG